MTFAGFLAFFVCILVEGFFSLSLVLWFFIFLLGLYLLFIGLTYLYFYFKSEKLKESSIYLDCIIINYKVDTKVKMGDKFARRIVCRYTWEDGRTKDFISEPILKNPDYYIGNMVRVYSDSSDFSTYLVNLETFKKIR